MFFIYTLHFLFQFLDLLIRYTAMTDIDPGNDVWERFISGSSSAFSEQYDAYTDILYKFGMRYSDNSELVKDCIHERWQHQ